MWSNREPVTLVAALGPSKRGWAALEPMFRVVASRVTHGRDVSYELIAFDTAGDIAWTVGVSRFTVNIESGPTSRRTLRLTHLYRREGGEWKVTSSRSQTPEWLMSSGIGYPCLAPT